MRTEIAYKLRLITILAAKKRIKFVYHAVVS